MKISIPDDLADAIESQLQPGQDLDGYVAKRLQQTAHIPLAERFLPLSYTDLDAIGMAAGRTIPPLTAAQIVAYIERLGQVRLGDVRIDFSVGQMEEIARLAAREHKTPAEYIGRVAASFMTQFFRTPPAAGEVPVVTVVETVEGVPAAQPAPVPV